MSDTTPSDLPRQPGNLEHVIYVLRTNPVTLIAFGMFTFLILSALFGGCCFFFRVRLFPGLYRRLLGRVGRYHPEPVSGHDHGLSAVCTGHGDRGRFGQLG